MNKFTVGEYVTLDEMLEFFSGRCSFWQFMPKEPAKYGLKMFAVFDARLYYTRNLEVYCGSGYYHAIIVFSPLETMKY